MIAALAAASLSVSPARATIVSGDERTIRVTNAGAAPVVLDAAAAGYALDLHGRARIVQGRSGRSWVTLRPPRLTIAAGGTGSLVVSATRLPGARPGDHVAVVLLTSRPRTVGGVAVRMRLGVVVSVRVPGAVVRDLELRELRVRRRGLLELSLANRGDVTERTSALLVLRRGGHVLARVRTAQRELLPHTAALLEFRYPARIRGWIAATVAIGGGKRHTFRLHL